MTPDEDWALRTATDGDRPGVAALLARAMPFDVARGPHQAVDAGDLVSACWDVADSDSDDSFEVPAAGAVVSLVSTQRCGVLPGPDGVPVAVPAGVAIGSVAPARTGAGGGGPGTGGGPIGHLALLAVDPTARRRGLGRLLLRTLGEQLRAAGADTLTTVGRPPRFGWPGADIRYTAFGLLAAAEGFQLASTAHNMTVDLDAASREGLLDTAADLARLSESGVTVRRATADDRAAVVDVIREFGGTWAAETLISMERDPVAVHLALRGGRVAGFACHATSRHGWFGPIGVSATERLGGAGAVLLRRCLVDIRAEGRAQAQICWVGPVGFYARAVGAYVDRTFSIYRSDR